VTWFDELMGFAETSPDEVRSRIAHSGATLRSLANGRTFTCGRLTTPSLAELRTRVGALPGAGGPLAVREVVADVTGLHADPANRDALFQVASQFNLLEMVGPHVTPEAGVGNYENDPTQGPACAIAAGAGTIYRNYFVEIDGRLGQSESRQIDCLADLGRALGRQDRALWVMRNGYALPTRAGLVEIRARLADASEGERDALRAKLRIGVQWDTEVTIARTAHTVTQAFCSALPVAYAPHPLALWEPFARLVLEAAYEATLCVADLRARSTGCRTAYLTWLGAGAFGNPTDWVADALDRALERCRGRHLDVVLVSHGTSRPEARRLACRFPD